MAGVHIQKGSRRSNALDLLAAEGIDCIPIPKKFNTFFPINAGEDIDFLNYIYYQPIKIGGDYTEISADDMEGWEIMEANPKLKLEENTTYKVIKINYI